MSDHWSFMLLSAIIHLTPQSELLSIPPLGHKTQGWLLGEVKSYLPALSKRLHKEGGYTVSGLQRQLLGKPGGYFLRVTSLVSDLTDVLLEAVLPNTQVISFSPRKGSRKKAEDHAPALTLPDFQVEGHAIEASAHPWAGMTPFAGLIQSAVPGEVLNMEFASPTAFRSSGADLPFPIPWYVLRSWAEKWNTFAPESERLGYLIHPFAQDCIWLTGLRDIHTRRWYLPNHARATGFLGKVEFSLEPVTRCKDWQALWDRVAKDWQILAAFAFYCGTGHHVASGMGQTRVLGKYNKNFL
jgi:CRISPR-associated endoribonuclease Cas6